ncbi:uncharacterized protein LOC132279541 isoform X1 [Cornus florida]|uniref:uncharacterized protein LOC132279541 isoform X1 n=1 Tax=Cornus florida TaxID=4283 RepID=UPI00289D874D|nr:uncharacterized protein LOC132279541 isoform X1 [Cornus florida]
MARVLSQTLIRNSLSASRNSGISFNKSPISGILTQRNGSNQSGKSQLIELDLESEGEVEVLGIRKLEDVIHNIIIKRSAPDWLPFIPGSSYWVPPRRRPYNVVELVGKLTSPLTDEETRSFTTVRGWPSSAFFLEGTSTTFPVPMEAEGEGDVKVQNNSENASQSEDEEG